MSGNGEDKRGLVGLITRPLTIATERVAAIRPDRVQDGVIRTLQRSRTVLGLTATVWLVMAYPMRVGRQDFVMGKLEDLLIGCGVTFGVGLLAVTAFISAARAPLGRRYASCLLGPAYCVVLILCGAGLFWLSWKALRGELVSFDGRPADLSWLTVVLLVVAKGVGGLVCLILLLFSVPFTVIVLVYGVNSCFRLGDVHDLLPALISPLLVWSLFLLNISDGPDVAAPPWVLYTFLLGGPVSVTLLSVGELHRLRRRHGLTLRSALGR
ncbi:hypothetical protein [Streptomyces sp. NPDC057623]|uniref:hypothetical protein n=1 Tax=Streptomyces sp. NPDC057623 TaxID=3346187 RepID=UPI0036802AB6